MKKSVIGLLFLLLSVGVVSAEVCNLDATLINQDPYPVNPGDYVKVVFQVNGVTNPSCKSVSFMLVEDFPFSLDPGVNNKVDIAGGTFLRTFDTEFLVPFDVRISEDALDGDNTIEAIVQFERENGHTVSQIEQFEINVQGSQVDFEVSIKEFAPSTNIMTFEILNVGENDVEALTVEIPKQDNILVKGPNRNIIGNLDANEDSTFKYEALPNDGEIKLDIFYTDSINVRRKVSTTVEYDSSYFTNRKADEVQSKSGYFYLFWLLLVIWILLWIRRRWKKRKERSKERKRKK